MREKKEKNERKTVEKATYNWIFLGLIIALDFFCAVL